MQRIEVKEQTRSIISLSDRDASLLTSSFGKQMSVSLTATKGKYEITPGSHVGTIRLTDCTIVIRPKVSIANLFWMLSYAHEIADFAGLDVGFEEYDDIFEFIVKIFASKVHSLAREGLTRGYVEQEANLSAVRGRISFTEDIRHNWAVKSKVYCRYVEHTEDIIENQILKLCCYLLLRMPLYDQSTVITLRSALGQFEGVSLVAITETDFDSVYYSRLNQRYTACINLARILLSHLSVSEHFGEVPAGSFLVSMEDLFERFVAVILKRQIELSGGAFEYQSGIRITRVEVGKSPIYGIPDMMVRSKNGNKVVLDTKYKDPGHESWKIGDIHQIVCYSAVAQSRLGILIYASPEGWSWARKLVNVASEIAAFSLPLNWEREAILNRLNEIARLCLFGAHLR